MKGSTVALILVLVVVVGVGGVLAMRALRPPPLTGAQKIGRGIGDLVGGIIQMAGG